MSLEGEAQAAARTILDARLAVAPDELVPTAADQALTPSEVNRWSLTRLGWAEAARANLLVAANAIGRPERSAVGKPWSSRFSHAMVLHLLNSAKDAKLEPSKQGALLVAASELQELLGDTNGTQGTMRRLEQLNIERRDLDWVLAMGLDESKFERALTALAVFHKVASSQRPATLGSQDSFSVDRTVQLGLSATARQASQTPLPPNYAPEPVTQSRTGQATRPTWLALGPADGAGEPATAAAWHSQDSSSLVSHGQLNQALAKAWAAFSSGDITDADDELSPIYSSFRNAWRPVTGPDGLILWNWLKLVRLAASANDTAYGSRRLAAVSAVELLTDADFGAADLDDLLETLVETAMSGLQPVTEKLLSRSFATYSGRLCAVIGHEEFFSYLGYSNDARARTRETWVREFPSLRLPSHGSSAQMAQDIKKAYREFQYRASEQADNYKLSPGFLDLLNSSSELLDPAEQDLVNEALTLLTDALTWAKVPSSIDVPSAYDLDSALQNLARDICVSGSSLLQGTLYGAIRGARSVLTDALITASQVSHPDIVMELTSAKLPLSAKSISPFSVRFTARNSGNSVAREIWAKASSDDLSFVVPAQTIPDLSPAAEHSLSFDASSTSANPTVSLTVRLTWSDDLGQAFETEKQYLAEDQRQSMWTAIDANPYTLKSINDPVRLVGRSAELASLEGILRMSDSTYVTGLKRVGKSSLVHTLLTKLASENGWAISMIPLGKMLGGSSNPASVALGVIDGISDALTDQGMDIEPPTFADSKQDEYARQAGRWLRSLEHSVPALKTLHVVVAIDDFDGMPMEFVEGSSGRGLFLFLRSLVDTPWLSLVFIGSEVMPAVIAGQGYQLNQVRRTPVDHFSSKEDTAQLLRAPTADRLEWSEDSIELIHQMANGNPYYATMIAQQLWDALRKLDRTLVEASDIAEAVTYVASNQEPFHFSHMWGDDPRGMAPKSRHAMLSAAVLLSAARCAATPMSSASVEEVLSVAQGIAGEATLDELASTLQRLLSRNILAVRSGSTDVAIRVPLFGEWLRSRGRRELEAEFEQFTHTRAAKRVITANDYVDLTDNLSYAGRSVNELQLQAWINQFGDDVRNRHLAFLLLKRLINEGYFTTSRLYRSILPRLKDRIREAVPELQLGRQNYISNAIIVSHGTTGSSAPAVVTNLHQVLRIKKENCVPVADVPQKLAKIREPVIIMVDDFAGTGNQLATSVDGLCSELDLHGDWRDSTIIVVGAAIAVDSSAWTAERFGGANIRPVVGHGLGSRVMAFDEDAKIFDSEDDRLRAKDLITVIGRALLPNNPLGWGEQGLLVLLESNCPNNTIPVFWKEGRYGGRLWKPLFPRAT